MYNQPLDKTELWELVSHSISFDNILGVAELSNDNPSIQEFDKLSLFQPDYLVIIWVQKGSCSLDINYRQQILNPLDILLILPGAIAQLNQFGSNFKGKLVICKRTLLEEWSMTQLSLSGYLMISKKPYYKLKISEMKTLDEASDLLRSRIILKTHNFHKQLVQLTFTSFLLETINIILWKNEKSFSGSVADRGEEITVRFLQLLLIYSKEKREVAFYADKLFITPQYLSLVLKNKTGETASNLITQTVITEAKKLLRSKRYSIQQVSDILHFADQSCFGKFFKKHYGISPLKYIRHI